MLVFLFSSKLMEFCSRYEFIINQGNMRFRFLISFNLHRFKESNGRKSKSKVINSILDQLTFAGCRFVTKTNNSENCESQEDRKVDAWEVVSKKDSRKKVAHAFRDKRHSQDFSSILARLQIRTGFQNRNPEHMPDSHIIAANAMMLTVKLSGNDRESYVNAVMCDAIDTVGAETDYFVRNRNFALHDQSRHIFLNGMRYALSKGSTIYEQPPFELLPGVLASHDSQILPYSEIRIHVSPYQM
jgi:hypothetical protein